MPVPKRRSSVDKHAPRPHKVDMPRRDDKVAAPKTPVKTAVKHKPRGSHAMVDNEGEDDAAARFAAGQLHLTADERARRSAGNRRKPKVKIVEASRTATGQHGFSKPTAPILREIFIGDSIVVSELANKLALKGGEVVRALFKMGVMATINQVIDHDTAVLVVEELGHKATKVEDNDAESALEAVVRKCRANKERVRQMLPSWATLTTAKPLCSITFAAPKWRQAKRVALPSISAPIMLKPRRARYFLPRHPRSLGLYLDACPCAKLTDIVVLVVAADDGVMPQTIEAVNHARAAKVPLLIAVNKMDKPEANPDNVKQGLVALEVVPEEWGGDVQFVPVSAKTGMGIDACSTLLVQAEVMELKAVYDALATGVVIESALIKVVVR